MELTMKNIKEEYGKQDKIGKVDVLVISGMLLMSSIAMMILTFGTSIEVTLLRAVQIPIFMIAFSMVGGLFYLMARVEKSYPKESKEEVVS